MIACDMRGVYVSYISCVVRRLYALYALPHDVLDQLLGTDGVTHSSYPVHVRRSPDKHIPFTVDPSPLFNPIDISKPLDRYPTTGSL